MATQRMTQAELRAAVDTAIGKVRPPVSAQDIEAVVALVQGMEGMAQGLANALASGPVRSRVGAAMAVDLQSVTGIAAQLRGGSHSAQDVVRASLARAAQVAPLNCVSRLLAREAIVGAGACDTARLAGKAPFALAGVPLSSRTCWTWKATRLLPAPKRGRMSRPPPAAPPRCKH